MMTAEEAPTGGSTFWGILAVGFFLAHLLWHAYLGDPENAVWACHVASLLIGIGGIVRNATLIAIGLSWLVVGIPLWLYHLAVGGPFVPTSLLTHFGSAAIGCILLRKSGFEPPKETIWWRACIALAILVAVSRFVTGRSDNINLAFDIHGRSDTAIGEHAQYLLVLAVVVSPVLYVSEIVLRRILFKSCDTS